jgi:hypothetical protein
VAHRHVTLGEAQPRRRDPGLGCRAVHPVQLVRADLSPRRHSRQGVRSRGAGRGAGRLPPHPVARPGSQGAVVYRPGGTRGLHRLHALRRGLPGDRQDRPEPQGHPDDATAADPRARGAAAPGPRTRTRSSSASTDRIPRARR